MTSQIAVFNKFGVAVASDTVMAISTQCGTKTTNNAQKIFPLPEPHLLVVIECDFVISDSIPVQLLITEWSRTLKNPLPTVKDYAKSFTDWYYTNSDLVPKESDRREVHSLLESYYYTIRNQVESDIDSATSQEEISASLKLHAQLGLKWLETLELFEGVSDADDAELLTELSMDLNLIIDSMLQDIPGLDEVRETLIKSAPLVLSRFWESSAGFAVGFIGFGEKDFFATLVGMRCRARYGKVARVKIDDSFGVSASSRGGKINCFLASTIIDWCSGADDLILKAVYSYIWSELTLGVEPDDEAKLNSASEFVDGLKKYVNDVQRESFVDPLLDTIGSLSLVDIASLARSLVGMQIIRSAASPESASVGGLIESLVIDRANGIRWIHRLPQIKTD